MVLSSPHTLSPKSESLSTDPQRKILTKSDLLEAVTHPLMLPSWLLHSFLKEHSCPARAHTAKSSGERHGKWWTRKSCLEVKRTFPSLSSHSGCRGCSLCHSCTVLRCLLWPAVEDRRAQHCWVPGAANAVCDPQHFHRVCVSFGLYHPIFFMPP